jgi:starvation-inducible DNA-binding protein
MTKTHRNSPDKSGSDGRSITSSRAANFTVPGLDRDAGRRVAAVLQERLASLVDLSLTLKHIHWNVVGPNFIGVHEMLDPQYQGTVVMIDDLAERIAALGGVPSGLPGRLTEVRTWTDYSLDRADSLAHLGALDLVYTGVIEAHRAAMDRVSDDDKVSEDLLIGQTGILERYHWFVRSHLEDWAGGMANAGSHTELDAASAVAAKRPKQVGRNTRVAS